MPEPTPEQKIDALRERAREWLDDNRPDLAADAAREALELMPQDVDARVLLADSLSQGGGEQELEEAVLLARAVTSERPDHLEAWLVLADASFLTEEPEQAREAAQRALKLDSGCDHAHALLAWLAVGEEDWPTVMEHADAALEIDPRQVNAASARQRARAALGLPDDRPGAAEAVKRAGETAREGLALLEQGREEEARERFRKALADDPAQLAARRGLARLGRRDHPLVSLVAAGLLGLAELAWPVRLVVALGLYGGYRWITAAPELDPSVVTLAVACGAVAAAGLIFGWCGPLAVDLALRAAPPLRELLPGAALALSRISGRLVALAVAIGLLALSLPWLALMVPALMLLAVLMPLAGLLRMARPGLHGFMAAYTLMVFGFAVATLIGTLVEWSQTPLMAVAGCVVIVLTGWVRTVGRPAAPTSRSA